MKEQVLKDLKAMLPVMKRISKDIRKIEDRYDWNNEDPDDMFLRNTLLKIEDHFSTIGYDVNRINSPIKEVGKLKHNSAKRYELPSGDYFTSGSGIEVLITLSDDSQMWAYSSIEHNGEDYYLTKFPKTPMKGLTARTREGGFSWED